MEDVNSEKNSRWRKWYLSHKGDHKKRLDNWKRWYYRNREKRIAQVREWQKEQKQNGKV